MVAHPAARVDVRRQPRSSGYWTILILVSIGMIGVIKLEE
jgi:hypothetical protein